MTSKLILVIPFKRSFRCLKLFEIDRLNFMLFLNIQMHNKTSLEKLLRLKIYAQSNLIRAALAASSHSSGQEGVFRVLI